MDRPKSDDMSTVGGGPNIVTNDLVLSLDTANPKSFVSGSTTWNDLTKNFNNCSLLNTPTYNQSNGGVLLFDGSDDYCQIPQITSNNTNGYYSFGLWFSPTNTIDASNANYIMLFEAQNTSVANTPDNYIYFLNSGGKITFGTNTPSNNLLTTTNNWVGGKWYNVFCTYDITTGTKSIYVNGILENSISGITNSYLNTSTYTGIGAYSSPTRIWFFPGKISNFVVYTKTLSSSEVLQNYNATKSRFGL